MMNGENIAKKGNPHIILEKKNRVGSKKIGMVGH